MILSECLIRNIIKTSLTQQLIKENEENEKPHHPFVEELKQKYKNLNKDKSPKKFTENLMGILDLCKNKINHIMWKNDKVEQQKATILDLFDYTNDDTAANFLKNQRSIEKIINDFPNSPLEILLQNAFTNQIILSKNSDLRGKDEFQINDPKKVVKNKQRQLIDLINDKSKHKEIVNRLIKTVKYRSNNKLKKLKEIWAKIINFESISSITAHKIIKYVDGITKKYTNDMNNNELDSLIKSAKTLLKADREVLDKAIISVISAPQGNDMNYSSAHDYMATNL
jgi:hypothetical protein